MGWTGKILRIDLTNGTTKSEPLNMEWADKYLGQRGLASKYLSEEMDPKADALGPDALLGPAPVVNRVVRLHGGNHALRGDAPYCLAGQVLRMLDAGPAVTRSPIDHPVTSAPRAAWRFSS